MDNPLIPAAPFEELLRDLVEGLPTHPLRSAVDWPVSRSIRRYPMSDVRATAPVVLSADRTKLFEQLQDWLLRLDLTEVNRRVRRRPRQRAAETVSMLAPARPRGPVEPHSLAYWNTSGRHGGLRRWG